VTLNCDAVLTEADGCTLDVVMVDVSQHGFRVQSLAELEPGSEVLLQMLKAPAVRGQIRWICGHQAGGVFLDPIAL
jgi:hypothetical protein